MDDKKKKYSWWESRTRIEKCLSVILACAVIVVIYLASNLLMASRMPSQDALQKGVCMTENCIRSAAKILSQIDKNVDPCTDIYKFACGNFIKEAIIPGDKTQVNSFSGITEKVDLQLMQVFDEPIHDNDPNYLQLVKIVYKSCMNTTKIEEEGGVFLRKVLKDLGGWPVVEQASWNERNFDWKTVLYRLQKIGWRRNVLFSIYVDTDYKNSSKRILTISQPCMPYERLKKGFNDTFVQATYKLLVDLSMLLGAERLAATVEMKEVVQFQIDLAMLLVPWEERKNSSTEYNPTTIRELQKTYPSLPWIQLINNFLSPVDMLTSDDIVNLANPKFFQRFENFLLRAKKRTIANYIFSLIIRDLLIHLPDEFAKLDAEFVKTVYGRKERLPRWKRCVMETGRLHIAVSSIYVRRFFDKSVKQKIAELNLDIKTAFLETLRKIAWMDRKTKRHAILKAEKMNAFIAYPEELFDDYKVDNSYSGLNLDPDEYYGKLCFNMSHFAHMLNIKKLREPTNKFDWRSQSYVFYVNAFYVQSENTIELPAAILQDSFFDPERPQYMNYGSIGEVIGHEITHGFDDRGRQYDKDGNLIDWWEPETNRTFAKKSQCLVDQYSNYTIPDIEMNVNGLKNLGENIADNGGIKIAYRGYLNWLERNNPEPTLPGLPYTPKQMFWISAASNWCTKYKKEVLKQLVTSGYHAPNYFRVTLPFMNSDHFAKDFNCPLGSPMNPKYKCRVW